MSYCWNGETTKADMFSELWFFQVPIFLDPTYLALSLRSTRSMDVIDSLPSNILISNCVRQCSSICLKELCHVFLDSQNLKQVCIQVLVWNMCTSFFRWFNDIWCVLKGIREVHLDLISSWCEETSFAKKFNSEAGSVGHLEVLRCALKAVVPLERCSLGTQLVAPKLERDAYLLTLGLIKNVTDYGRSHIGK